ncbi:MAG TPA: Hsp33 family molecular chaperone HslO, partial [Pseudobacillus sp.]
MGAMLKGEEKITVKIEGGGPIGAILVDANSKGKVRGYVTNPQTHFDLNEHGKLDVRRAVGTEGMLTVVKDLGLREHFSGQTPIVSGELGEDFTYYFVASEQVPSSVGVGVLVNPDNSILAAGGFVIQIMPGAEEEVISTIEERISNMTPISKLIEKGMSPEEILYYVLGKENVKILEQMPVSFECTCSKERFGNAVVSLGKEEIQEMIDEDGQAEAQCHFCNEKYLFTKDELRELKEAASI